MVGPGHQVAVARAMEQVVDGLAAHRHPELAPEDAADVGRPEGADAIPGRRRGVEPLLEPGVVLRVEPPGSSGPRPLVEGLDAAAVVLGDPVLDGAERAAQAPCDVRGGPSLLGEDDGLEPPPEAFLWDGLGHVPELFGSVMVGDEHRRGPRGGQAAASS